MILLIAISQFKENLYCSIFLNLLRSAENENSLNIPIEKYTCILRLPPKRTRWLLFLFFKTRADVNYIWLKIKRFSNGFFLCTPPPSPIDQLKLYLSSGNQGHIHVCTLRCQK